MRFLCCLRIPTNSPMNLVNMIDFKPHSIYHIHSYSSRIYLLLRTKNIYCFLLLITIESPPVSTLHPILAAQVLILVLKVAQSWSPLESRCHLTSPHLPLPSYCTRVWVWSLTLPLQQPSCSSSIRAVNELSRIFTIGEKTPTGAASLCYIVFFLY